jgi:hypothetical protein
MRAPVASADRIRSRARPNCCRLVVTVCGVAAVVGDSETVVFRPEALI